MARATVVTEDLVRHGTQIGLQLYTIRDACARDLFGALERTREVGYRFVEWAGGLGESGPDDLAAHLERIGLGVIARHVGYAQLKEDLPRIVDECEAMRCRLVVCPWLEPGERNYEAVGLALQEAAYRLASHGLRLAYHHHDFELTTGPVRGVLNGLETILSYASHPTFGVELDTFWLEWAGADSASTIRQLGGQVFALHLKDGLLPPLVGDAGRGPGADAAEGDGPTFRPLGRGDVDITGAVSAARDEGVKALIVEQDFCDGDPFVAAAQSRRALEALLEDPPPGSAQ